MFTNKPNEIYISSNNSQFEKLALLNFSALCFFTFMGTGLPFQESAATAYEGESSNLVNQVVFIFLFVSAFIIIIQNHKNTTSFILKDKYLFIFVFFCFISFLWSDYSLISFKRSFQLVVTYVTIVNAVLHVRSINAIKSLKIVTYIYIITTFISGMFIPQAIDPNFGTWRGIELQKNLLGHVSLMIFILGLYFYNESYSKFSKYDSIFLIILSTLSIFLSGSTTNLIGLVLILLILIVTYSDRVFYPIGIRKLNTTLAISILSIAAIVFSLYSSKSFSTIPELFGKDPSLTGRDVIWSFIWNEIQKKFWIGYAYGTYWIMGTTVIDIFQAVVGWKVNEAHNGYLEIMLQLGMIGFSLFILLLISFIRKIYKTGFFIAFLALVAILEVNFSESFIFQPRNASTLVFMFFYLISIPNNLNTEKH